ncbi:MAG TPA: hypothetical protein DD381_12380 [Lentisphaeria bacterium]|nr:MAG: hypothetical protein A2X47_09360 [Lentisphaerae bacterium GWF2_38_69]HBM17123.1 hypothetical protein [Lentisphaeria bacterium]
MEAFVPDLYCILFLSVVIFIACFIDSIAGGGGLLTIPAYLFAGLPAQYALGTNKLVMSAGTSVAAFNYIRNKKVIWKVVFSGLFFAVIGSILGTKAILLFDHAAATKIITILLPVGLVAVLIPKKKRKTHVEEELITRSDLYFKAPLICLITGFYDGFFGPGTGAFLAIGFYVFMDMDLLKATGNAKIFNLASNVGSMVTFIIAGKIVYSIVLPLVSASMLGNYAGSHFAIKKGTGFIKLFLVLIIILVFISMFAKHFTSS